MTIYAEFLRLHQDRIVFLPWPSNIPLSSSDADKGYIFAAGRSMRDWKTLFECSASFQVPFVVAASEGDVASLSVPPNVHLHCDISHEKYRELLSGALIVILPLKGTVRSTGQAVALEAMAMRKPLVAADTPGILDYVRDEETGLLCRTGDPASLMLQLNRLPSNAELRAKVTDAAEESIQRVFCNEAYSHSLCELLAKLVKSRIQ
jgi:glycosyltransferase involved in cell wall biosynthesis